MLPIHLEKIAGIIRQHVPRPREADCFISHPGPLPVYPGPAAPPKHKFAIRIQSAGHLRGCCCPLGLLPLATASIPSNTTNAGLDHLRYTTGRVFDYEVQSLGIWWDEQYDIPQAIEDVWGPA